MTENLGSLARKLALPYYEDALPGHDRFHAARVNTLANRLADEIDVPVNREVLSAAAWFHDIGRPMEHAGEIDHHDKWAAIEVRDLLADEDIYPPQIQAVAHCIRSHSIRPTSPEPESMEAKLLFDADKLEATGARGLLRMACIIGERSGVTGEKFAVLENTSLLDEESPVPDITVLKEWASERLDRLHTQPAGRLGTSRQQFMDDFFTRFNSEIGLQGDR